MRRGVFVKTYGCQMNVYDSDRMAESLAMHGYRRVAAAELAELVILNTCHIREKAAEKVYSELGRLRRLQALRRRDGGELRLAVAGCVAQAEGAALQTRAPFVDVVVGPQSYHRLPELLARCDRDEGRQLDTEFPVESKFDEIGRAVDAAPVSAFLTIQEGCDKFCSFCVVPYTRGQESSRAVGDLLAEARMLIAAGARELTLLGQNVNAYHGRGLDGRDWPLARLLEALALLPGLMRLRYTTSHPRDMSDDLICAHAEIDKLMPFLHLPVQSGSDAILQAMNRGYGRDDYRRLVARLRGARPDLALSTDVIVGFPGESDADFALTLELVREIGFAQAFSFCYSRRPGTPAAGMRRQVPAEVQRQRLATLQALLDAQAAAFNRASLGRRTAVLIERAGRHEGQLVGRTPWLQAVHVDGAGLARGDLVEVRITRCEPHSLAGTVVRGAAAVPICGALAESSV